MIVTTMNRRCW